MGIVKGNIKQKVLLIFCLSVLPLSFVLSQSTSNTSRIMVKSVSYYLDNYDLVFSIEVESSHDISGINFILEDDDNLDGA